MAESLRTAGWEGPLGWPDIDPKQTYTWDIESYIYHRTTIEKTPVSIQKDFSLSGWLFSDDRQSNEEVLKMLDFRYQIDEEWENLTKELTNFIALYGNMSNLTISTAAEYDAAYAAIYSISAKLSYMDRYYNTLLSQTDNLINKMETSLRNNIDISYAVVDGEVLPEYEGDYYKDWYAATAAQAANQDAVGGSTSVFANIVFPTLGVNTRQNRMTTAQSYSFLKRYQEWVNTMEGKLASMSTSKDINGESFAYDATFPRNVYIEDIQTNMKKFASDIQMIDSLCMDISPRSVWIFLQIGNIKFSTWDKSNYIVNFDYKKNGSGTANSFTFDLAYNPPPGDTDINKLEKVISKRKVFFQYGYNELTNVCSPQYEGQILSYTVAIENNFIKYTITGYSEAADARFGKVSINSYGAYIKDENGNDTEEVAYGKPATEYARDQLSLYLGKYGYEIYIDESAAGTDVDTVINGPQNVGLFDAIDNILMQAKLSDETKSKIIGSNTTDEGEVITDLDSIDCYYTYKIDDAPSESGNKRITIIRVLTKNELEVSDIVPSVAFAWGGDFNGQEREIYDVTTQLTAYSDQEQAALLAAEQAIQSNSEYTKGKYRMLSNVVVGFSTSYAGEVTLARAYQEATKNLRINQAGELVETGAIYSKFATGDTNIADEKYSYWLWERNTMFSYNASLTLIGVPTDIPIGTYLYIKPMVNGVEHHTAGFYYVTGSEDKVTSSGYTTTINLVRIIDRDTDSTLKLIDTVKNPDKYKQGNKFGVGLLSENATEEEKENKKKHAQSVAEYTREHARAREGGGKF